MLEGKHYYLYLIYARIILTFKLYSGVNIVGNILALSTALSVEPSYPSFDELVNLFLSCKDLKPSSKQSYIASFAQFESYLKEMDVILPREYEIKQFKDYLTQKKLSVFTVISHLSALKSLFSFLATRNVYPDIAKYIKVPKKPKEFMRDPLTKEQAKQLMMSAKGDSLIEKRDYAIISTLLRCGLRSIEIIRANISDVRQSGGTPVLWVHGKGRDSKDEFVVLTNEALSAIREYLSLRSKFDNDAPLFASHGPRNANGRMTTRSIRRLIKNHLKAIDIADDRLTCHSLRHTFATLALANNAPLIAVQKAMRHANINTTTIYTHMQDRLISGAEHYIDI